ncbi:MAG: hypothetical protein LAP39_09180 [Acidobacteriia bacterium]|nr:hypothetical protein [Terriglobia bacterium]
MSNDPLIKVNAATAAEVCQRYEVQREARALLRDGMGPFQFLEAVAGKKLYVDGIDFLAHALPAREGIWWGCLCLQHACGDTLTPAERNACIAAVRWVSQPTEENRLAAKAPADGVGMSSPAGALALAAHGGLPPPGPFAPAKAVAMAVKLAALKSPPAAMIDTQRSYLQLGVSVAAGKVG